MKIRMGRRYQLRSGATVVIVGQRDIPFIEGRTKKPMFISLWIGKSPGTLDRCSWHTNGRYAPGGHDHQNDITGACLERSNRHPREASRPA